MSETNRLGVSRVNVNVGSVLVEQLKDYSWRNRLTVSAAVRKAVVRLLEQDGVTAIQASQNPPTTASTVAR